VGAGAADVALAAARTDADVTGTDFVPELLFAARHAAAEAGLSLRWVDSEAESLPFPAGAFDVVLPMEGANAGADQRAVARELVRVRRPGGTIGMANWTREGLVGQLEATLALAGDPNRTADLDEALLDLGEWMNTAGPGEPARFELEYLLVVATTKGS
jgi:ubiquinone/menaquinone biosynthesis C-methylase UbiE